MDTGHQIAFLLRELSAADPARRAAAVKGLGRIGRAEHADVVAGAARDPEAVVRAGAADALGRLGVPAAGTTVIGLMRDADPGVRRRASLAAERLALTGPAVTEAFERLLHDTDWHLRLNGLIALTRRGEFDRPEELVRLLGDTEPAVWGRARGALAASLHQEAVLDRVLHTARQGRGVARARALELLPARHTPQLRDSLLEGIRDEVPEVRRAVVDKLAEDPQPDTVDVLPAALGEECDPDVARQLLNVLGRRGERRALPVAVRWLDHPGVGPSAVLALAGIGTPTARRWIRTALTSGSPGHPYVRATAATALGDLADPRAVELLLPLLHDADERIRVGALDGLRLLGRHRLPRRQRHRVADALIDRLLSDATTVWYTRNALASYPETRPRVRGLVDEVPDEARAAVLSLLDADDVDLFLAHLDDPHEPVRYHALLGLTRHVQEHGTLPARDNPPFDVLTALAADPSRRTGRAAAELLDIARHRWCGEVR